MVLALLVSAVVTTVTAPGAEAQSKCTHPARVERNVRYLNIEGVEPGLTSLDIYEPPADGECRKAPVVMWVHGGGWRKGDKRHAVTDKVRLFNDAGYVFVSVNYRLTNLRTPEPIRYPTHNEDVAAAVAWMVDNAADHGGDPKRIALLGHSAGAGIVASVGTDERYLAEHDLDLDALRCVGPLDTQAFDVSAVIDGGGLSAVLYRGIFGTDPEQVRDASPLTHVEAGKSIPDMLLVERGEPARRAILEKFADALRDAKVDVTVIDGSALTHGQVNTQIGAPDDQVMTRTVMKFLRSCFD
jgi:acetyl esterase/lipase